MSKTPKYWFVLSPRRKFKTRTCVVALGKHEKKLPFKISFHPGHESWRDAHADESEDIIGGIY